ncbi:MAG: co-chaperone GroES [Mycoplasma sp.]|nr:co-chaperone GroES [Mycoplasma sp.]
MNFKPIGERVLVERSEAETKTNSGIIIQTNSNEKPAKGVIKAISDKVKDDFKVGQTVAFKEYKGSEIKVNGKNYLVLEAEDILGIFDK